MRTKAFAIACVAAAILGEAGSAAVTSRTVYVDDHSVFELSSGAMKLGYENIVTPYGNEGRVEAGGAVKYYLKDRLGSTRVTMTDAGGTEESQMYYSFGREKYLVHPPKMTREKFTGKELDYDGPVFGVNGMFLSYFGARYYDAEVGVWTSTDPLKQYYSSYAYSANPANVMDPDGRAGVHASLSGGITWGGKRYGGAYTLTANHDGGKSIFNPFSYSIGLLKTVNLTGGLPSADGAATAWGFSAGVSNSDIASQVTGGGKTTGFTTMGLAGLGKWLSGGLGFDISNSYSDDNFSIPTVNAKGAPVRILDFALRLPGKTAGAETHDQVKTHTDLIWQAGGKD